MLKPLDAVVGGLVVRSKVIVGNGVEEELGKQNARAREISERLGFGPLRL